MFIAWWIAFGPHGPRALDPPGEWTRIWLYTAIGVGVSAVLFFGVHAFARPPPRTMTKEWQEATNEYLKVWRSQKVSTKHMLTSNRKNESTLSMVSPARATMARDLYRANLRRLKGLRSRRRNRILYQISNSEARLKFSLLSRLLGGCMERLWHSGVHSTCTELEFQLFHAIDG